MMRQISWRTSGWAGSCLAAWLFCSAAGCGSTESEPSVASTPPAGDGAADQPADAGSTPGQAESPTEKPATSSDKNPPDRAKAPTAAPQPSPAPPTAAEIWTGRVREARRLVEAEDLEGYDKLRESWNAANDVAALEAAMEEPQAAELKALERQVAAKRAEQTAKWRVARLTEAQASMDQGRLDEALRGVGEVLARNPTDEQRTASAAISEEVERRRKARRQLKSWLQMLASDDRKNVQTAQTQLQQDPETAVGMVLEALAADASGTKGANYLETLRLLNRPEMTTPAMAGILERPEQAALWPEVTQELIVTRPAGLAPRLLALAKQASVPGQRQAALAVLAHVPDLPSGTLPALAPLVAHEGPELAQTLATAVAAVRLHEQYDWVAERGLEERLTDEERAALTALPKRLAELSARSGDEGANEVAFAARRLAALLGFIESQPVTGVKVARVEGELPESPAAGLVDGVWDSVELKSMWRHPPDKRGAILLDLGAERVVTGIRLWNLNEPAAMARGWKEVDIFVSMTPAEFTPAASGIVPVAPGAANHLDYGTLIPIPAVRGRYVRIQGKSVWQADGPNGLSEIQVLAAP